MTGAMLNSFTTRPIAAYDFSFTGEYHQLLCRLHMNTGHDASLLGSLQRFLESLPVSTDAEEKNAVLRENAVISIDGATSYNNALNQIRMVPATRGQIIAKLLPVVIMHKYSGFRVAAIKKTCKNGAAEGGAANGGTIGVRVATSSVKGSAADFEAKFVANGAAMVASMLFKYSANKTQMLTLAVQTGRTCFVDALLSAGADASLVSFALIKKLKNLDCTNKECKAQNCHRKLVNKLVQHGGNPRRVEPVMCSTGFKNLAASMKLVVESFNLALCLGTHQRVGVDSPFSLLDAELIQMISRLAGIGEQNIERAVFSMPMGPREDWK